MESGKSLYFPGSLFSSVSFPERGRGGFPGSTAGAAVRRVGIVDFQEFHDDSRLNLLGMRQDCFVFVSLKTLGLSLVPVGYVIGKA